MEKKEKSRMGELKENGAKIIAKALNSPDPELKAKAGRIQALIEKLGEIKKRELELGVPKSRMARGSAKLRIDDIRARVGKDGTIPDRPGFNAILNSHRLFAANRHRALNEIESKPRPKPKTGPKRPTRRPGR